MGQKFGSLMKKQYLCTAIQNETVRNLCGKVCDLLRFSDSSSPETEWWCGYGGRDVRRNEWHRLSN